MIHFQEHLLSETRTIKEAVRALNELSGKDSQTLFLADERGKLTGSLTDGDIRRALLKDIPLNTLVSQVMNKGFLKLQQNGYGYDKIRAIKAQGIDLLPIVDQDGRMLRLINLKTQRSLLPVDAIIMAGGKGKRLRPLTKHTPKPLLVVGPKPIVEHNVDWLIQYGISNITFSIGYLGNQLRDYFRNGQHKNIHIQYVEEEKPLGTAGALSLVEDFTHDAVLIMNSDLLTNIDLEAFYQTFSEKGAALAVATTPYDVKIPYAVLEIEEGRVHSFAEKPTYTYYSNAGIYLIKKEVISKYIEKGAFCDATDLMERLLAAGEQVVSFPIRGYWLDIGRREDYERAQEDIKHIKF